MQTPLNEAPGQMLRRPPDGVEIFASGPPARPHVDVALLHLENCAGCTHEDRMGELREAAARMGCDALFVESLSARDSTGTCIAYSDVSGTDEAAGRRGDAQSDWCRRNGRGATGDSVPACFGSSGM